MQREMDGMLREHPYARAYIDDVVVFSNSLKEHLNHLSKIFALFESWNITLKASKTYFGYLSISLLGQKVNSFELATSVEKLKAITDLSFPKTLKDLETYFEMTGYLRDYVEHYAQKAEALQRRKTALLKNSPIKGTARKNFSCRTLMENLSQDELNSYETFKADFSKPSWLTHFDVSRELYADIDASKKGFGVMVYHRKKKMEKSESDQKPPSKREVDPILFLSKTLTGAESRYWPTELEMAALVLSNLSLPVEPRYNEYQIQGVCAANSRCMYKS